MLRFGLVGCGRISIKHSDLLGNHKIKGAKLAAVCDIVLEKAKALGEKFDVPYFTDMHQMLTNVELDVVTILTPSGDHAQHTLELAKYRKHLVVEKPMALTLNDADAMIKACDENRSRLFIVKQNRFNIPIVKLKSAVESGKFGKITLGTIRVRWCREQKYYDQDSWRGTWEKDGGVLTNQASHHIDLLMWMMGDVESVFAKSGTFLVNTETEDTGVVLLKFTSGALGIIEATTAARPKDLEGSISILGEKGSVEIGGFAVNKIVHWSFVNEETDTHFKEENSNLPPNVYGFGHSPYLDHVVDCIKNETPLLVDGLEGRKSLEVITAIYESIETGREIFLNTKPQHCRLGRKSK